MAEDYIWIVTDDAIDLPLSVPEGTRDAGGSRNPFDDPRTIELPTRRGIPVQVQKLEQGMTDFLTVLGRVFNHVKLRSGELAGMELDEIELSVEINGEGQVSLLGTGSKIGGKGAMTLKFKKTSPNS
jgi:hypothetical protein